MDRNARTRSAQGSPALGATGDRVAWLIVRRTMAIAIPGVAIGLATALVVTRLLTKSLFEVSPTDPWTFWFVALILERRGAFARGNDPRRGARSRVDPMVCGCARADTLC